MIIIIIISVSNPSIHLKLIGGRFSVVRTRKIFFCSVKDLRLLARCALGHPHEHAHTHTHTHAHKIHTHTHTQEELTKQNRMALKGRRFV